MPQRSQNTRPVVCAMCGLYADLNMESAVGNTPLLEIAEAACEELSLLDDPPRGSGINSLQRPIQSLRCLWPWNPPASTVPNCYSPDRVHTIMSGAGAGAANDYLSPTRVATIIPKLCARGKGPWHSTRTKTCSQLGLSANPELVEPSVELSARILLVQRKQHFQSRAWRVCHVLKCLLATF